MTAMTGKPTDLELRRFIADCNTRRLGWALFQKNTRRTALRILRDQTEQENQNT